MEYVKTDDSVIFTANFYHPASGYSVAADSTPQYLVYEGTTGAAILNGSMSARTDHVGAYYGSFTASVANGFDSGTFYDVQVSGAVGGITGISSVKQFVLDDIFNTNIVQVSGEYVGLANQSINANVVQVSGEYVSINDFVDTLTAADVRAEMDANSLQLVAISGNVAGLDGEAMRGTDNAALAATALTNATWTDARAAYLDLIPNLSTKTSLEAVSGVLVARTLVSTNYFDPATDTVAHVTLVDTTTDVTNDVGVGSIADNAITQTTISVGGGRAIADYVWDEAVTEHVINNSAGQVLNTAKSGVLDIQTSLTTIDQDIYFANIKYVKDTTNLQDEFAVQWFKNDQPVSSGDLTAPSLSVYNTSTGTPVIEHQLMTYASPNLGVVRYNNVSVMSSGEPYLVETSGTIDTNMRTWKTIVGIDLL